MSSTTPPRRSRTARLGRPRGPTPRTRVTSRIPIAASATRTGRSRIHAAVPPRDSRSPERTPAAIGLRAPKGASRPADRRREVAEPGREARSRSRDLDVLDLADRVVPDCRHDAPACPSSDGLGRRHVERVDTEHDHLGIRFDERFERDLVVGGVAGGDHVTAGQCHHLGHERGIGRGEDLAGRIRVADLVELPRRVPGCAGRGADGIHLGPHRGHDRPRLVALADGGADQLDVLVHALDRRGVDDEDGDVEAAELGDDVGRREPEPAGQDEVRFQVDDAFDVDRGKVGDIGQWHRPGREVATAVGRDDTVTDTELEQDLGVRGSQ